MSGQDPWDQEWMLWLATLLVLGLCLSMAWGLR